MLHSFAGQASRRELPTLSFPSFPPVFSHVVLAKELFFSIARLATPRVTRLVSPLRALAQMFQKEKSGTTPKALLALLLLLGLPLLFTFRKLLALFRLGERCHQLLFVLALPLLLKPSKLLPAKTGTNANSQKRKHRHPAPTMLYDVNQRASYSTFINKKFYLC